MTHDEAITILKEDALDQAIHMIEFLHGCLMDPEVYKYAYPEDTLNRLDEFRALVPARPACVHSFKRDDCEACIQHREWYARHHEALEVVRQGLGT